MARRKKGDDPRGFGIATSTFMLLTVIFAFAALVVAGTALSNSEDAQSSAAAAGGPVVTLTEFTIDPTW